MPNTKHGQSVDDNKFGQKAIRRMAQDLNRFNDVIRTLELRRMGLGSCAADENSEMELASDEDVLEYFSSVDAVYGQMETKNEDPKPTHDEPHSKPLPGTRPRPNDKKPHKLRQ